MTIAWIIFGVGLGLTLAVILYVIISTIKTKRDR